ncbi:MAG: hypothetical protein F6K03_06280 [Kamptonema sp. SIO4C4]|nr:hypothetical protein [Kamptonema sp. SIO4C4]
MAIERVAVLGAGVMGSGIAAHVANAGVPVRLLDIVPDSVVYCLLTGLTEGRHPPIYQSEKLGQNYATCYKIS